MSSILTQPTAQSVEPFLNTIGHPLRKSDGLHLLEIYKEKTGENPVMRRPGIVGFGKSSYNYSSG